MKHLPIWLNAVNVGSDLQNDSSTDLVVDSSDTALVNNCALRASATSEFMDVGVTDGVIFYFGVI